MQMEKSFFCVTQNYKNCGMWWHELHQFPFPSSQRAIPATSYISEVLHKVKRYLPSQTRHRCRRNRGGI